MRILDCPECDWTTKPKHKRPKSALGLHRKAKHGNGVAEKPVSPAEAPVPAIGTPVPMAGFHVTFTSVERCRVLAQEHQELEQPLAQVQPLEPEPQVQEHQAQQHRMHIKVLIAVMSPLVLEQNLH